MLNLQEHGALVERFAVAKPDYAVHAGVRADITRETNDQTLLGQKSGSVDGAMKLSSSASTDTSKAMKEKLEKSAQNRASDAMLLAMLNDGTLDAYIAKTVVDEMSDAEIEALVETIEAETGKSLGDYAKEILGDEMPERTAGESDIDYQRRVIEAVTEEVLENGKISPEYADDPVAKAVVREQIYQDMQPRIDAINAAQAINTVASEENLDVVRNLVGARYENGNVMRDGILNEELVVASRDVQDDQRDSNIASEVSQDSVLGMFGSGGSMDFAAGPGLEGAPDVSGSFVQAAADTGQSFEPQSPAPTPSVTI